MIIMNKKIELIGILQVIGLGIVIMNIKLLKKMNYI